MASSPSHLDEEHRGCGLYRTTVAIEHTLAAGVLVFFHNHGDPGPGLYLPQGWKNNRALFHGRGILLPDPSYLATLQPLLPEGLYRVRDPFFCCEDRCHYFEEELLVQLGYNARAEMCIRDRSSGTKRLHHLVQPELRGTRGPFTTRDVILGLVPEVAELLAGLLDKGLEAQIATDEFMETHRHRKRREHRASLVALVQTLGIVIGRDGIPQGLAAEAKGPGQREERDPRAHRPAVNEVIRSQHRAQGIAASPPFVPWLAAEPDSGRTLTNGDHPPLFDSRLLDEEGLAALRSAGEGEEATEPEVPARRHAVGNEDRPAGGIAELGHHAIGLNLGRRLVGLVAALHHLRGLERAARPHARQVRKEGKDGGIDPAATVEGLVVLEGVERARDHGVEDGLAAATGRQIGVVLLDVALNPAQQVHVHQQGPARLRLPDHIAVEDLDRGNQGVSHRLRAPIARAQSLTHPGEDGDHLRQAQHPGVERRAVGSRGLVQRDTPPLDLPRTPHHAQRGQHVDPSIEHADLEAGPGDVALDHHRRVVVRDLGAVEEGDVVEGSGLLRGQGVGRRVGRVLQLDPLVHRLRQVGRRKHAERQHQRAEGRQR